MSQATVGKWGNNLVSVHKRMIFGLESIALGDGVGRLERHFICCGGCVG
jgi:hypothetical protein